MNGFDDEYTNEPLLQSMDLAWIDSLGTRPEFKPRQVVVGFSRTFLCSGVMMPVVTLRIECGGNGYESSFESGKARQLIEALSAPKAQMTTDGRHGVRRVEVPTGWTISQRRRTLTTTSCRYEGARRPWK